MWVFLICVAAFALPHVAAAGAGAGRLLCYVRQGGTDFTECTHIVYIGPARGYHLEALLKEYKMHNPHATIMLRVTDADRDLLSLVASSNAEGLEIFEAHKSLNRSNILNRVQSAREALHASGGKFLYMALPAHPELLAKYYDLRGLARKVDLMTVQTHALGVLRGVTYHPSRLSGLWDMMNTDSVVDLVIGLGVPPSKIIISLPTTAGMFTLVNETLSTPGSPTMEDYPREIDQVELCRLLQEGGWTLERDQDLSAPYAFRGKTWLSFEDASSVDVKGKYARVRGLAGLALHKAERDTATPCAPALRSSLQKVLNRQSRAPKAAVLRSLEHEILSAPGYATALGPLQVSPYRITQVVDADGVIHSVREDTRTEFTCSRQGYFRHPRSCARFYRCVKFDQNSPDYTVFEFDCPPGLAFDSRYEVCGWPGSIPDSHACPGSSEIAPVPKSRFVCPSKEGYYADPENCRWFFACLNHGRLPLTAYEFRCPFGLGFDAQRLKCDWPWRVPGCGKLGKYEAQAYGFSGGSLGERTGFHGRTADAVNIAAHQSLLSGAALDNLVGIQAGLRTNSDFIDPSNIREFFPKKTKCSRPIGYSTQGVYDCAEHEAKSYLNYDLGFKNIYAPKYAGSLTLDDYKLPAKDVHNIETIRAPSYPEFFGALKTVGLGSDQSDDDSGAYVHDPSGDYAETYKHEDISAVPYSPEYTEYKPRNDYQDSSSQSNGGLSAQIFGHAVSDKSQTGSDESVDYTDSLKNYRGAFNNYAGTFNNYAGAYKNYVGGFSNYGKAFNNYAGTLNYGGTNVYGIPRYGIQETKIQFPLQSPYVSTFLNNFVNQRKNYPLTGPQIGLKTLPNGAISMGLVGKTSLIDPTYTDQFNYNRFRSGARKFFGFNYNNPFLSSWHPPNILPSPFEAGIRPILASAFRPQGFPPYHEAILYADAFVTPKAYNNEPFQRAYSKNFNRNKQKTTTKVETLESEDDDYGFSSTVKPKNEIQYKTLLRIHGVDDETLTSTAKPDDILRIKSLLSQHNLESDDEEQLRDLIKKYKQPTYTYEYNNTSRSDDDDNYDGAFGLTHKHKQLSNFYKYTTAQPVETYSISTGAYTQQINKAEDQGKFLEKSGFYQSSPGYEYSKPTIKFEEVPKTSVYPTSSPAYFTQKVIYSTTPTPAISTQSDIYSTPTFDHSTLYASPVFSTSTPPPPTNIHLSFHKVEKVHSSPFSTPAPSYNPTTYGNNLPILKKDDVKPNIHLSFHKVEQVNFSPFSTPAPSYDLIKLPILNRDDVMSETLNEDSIVKIKQHSEAHRDQKQDVKTNSIYSAVNRFNASETVNEQSTSQPTIISLPQNFLEEDASNANTYSLHTQYKQSAEGPIVENIEITHATPQPALVNLPHTYHREEPINVNTYSLHTQYIQPNEGPLAGNIDITQSTPQPVIIGLSQNFRNEGASNVNTYSLHTQYKQPAESPLEGNIDFTQPTFQPAIVSLPHSYHREEPTNINTYSLHTQYSQPTLQQDVSLPHSYHRVDASKVNTYTLHTQYKQPADVIVANTVVKQSTPQQDVVSIPQTYHRVDANKVSAYSLHTHSHDNKLNDRYETITSIPKTLVEYRNPTLNLNQKSSPVSIYRIPNTHGKHESNRVTKQCIRDKTCQHNLEYSQSFINQPEIQRDLEIQSGVRTYSDAALVSHQNNIQHNSDVVFVSSTPAALVYEDHYIENDPLNTNPYQTPVLPNLELNAPRNASAFMYENRSPLPQFRKSYQEQVLGPVNLYPGPEIQQERNYKEHTQLSVSTVAPSFAQEYLPPKEDDSPPLQPQLHVQNPQYYQSPPNQGPVYSHNLPRPIAQEHLSPKEAEFPSYKTQSYSQNYQSQLSPSNQAPEYSHLQYTRTNNPEYLPPIESDLPSLKSQLHSQNPEAHLPPSNQVPDYSDVQYVRPDVQKYVPPEQGEQFIEPVDLTSSKNQLRLQSPQPYLPPLNRVSEYSRLRYERPVAQEYLPPKEVQRPFSTTAKPQNYLPPPTEASEYSRLHSYDERWESLKSTSYTTATSATSSNIDLPKRVKTTHAPLKYELPATRGGPVIKTKPKVAEIITTKPKVAVVTKINDFNPFLVKKLGAVCSCQSAFLKLKGSRPGARTLIPDYDDYSFDGNDSNQSNISKSNEKGHKNTKLQKSPKTATSTTSRPIVVADHQDFYNDDGVVNSKSYNIQDNSKSESFDFDKDEFASSTPRAPIRIQQIKTKFRNKGTTIAPDLEGEDALDEHAQGTTRDQLQTSSTTPKSFNRYGPGGWRKRTETLQGSVDCKRAGLFRHPRECNKFYACNWDDTKKQFTLHVFNCPVQLSFDPSMGACNWPSQGPACQGDTLLTNNV